MPTNCSKITAGIALSCDDELVGGTKARLILFNQSDIVDYDYNVTNTQMIEGINLVTSPLAKGFVFEGENNSIEEVRTLVKGAFRKTWNHQILFRIFTNTPEAKEQIEALKNSKVVAILENNYQGVNGNGAFELYGKVQGLELNVLEANKNDADSQGAYTLTLGSPDNQKEPKLPATIFLTSYAVTKAIVDSLI